VTAWLGLFAVLFQAILFGWHHHDIDFAGRLPAPVVENPAASHLPCDDADGCEICQTLHHQTAVGADFVAPPLSLAAAEDLLPGEAALAARAPALAFRARAPPSSDAAAG
jgi:hypothetical protein